MFKSDNPILDFNKNETCICVDYYVEYTGLYYINFVIYEKLDNKLVIFENPNQKCIVFSPSINGPSIPQFNNFLYGISKCHNGKIFINNIVLNYIKNKNNDYNYLQKLNKNYYKEIHYTDETLNSNINRQYLKNFMFNDEYTNVLCKSENINNLNYNEKDEKYIDKNITLIFEKYIKSTNIKINNIDEEIIELIKKELIKNIVYGYYKLSINRPSSELYINNYNKIEELFTNLNFKFNRQLQFKYNTDINDVITYKSLQLDWSNLTYDKNNNEKNLCANYCNSLSKLRLKII
jgi:hypothetical protein